MFELDKDTTNLMTGAISVGVGFTAWLYTATQQQMTTPLFTKQRLSDAIAGAVGPNLAAKITGTSTGAKMKLAPMGWLNKVTIGGIILKVANILSRKYTEKFIDSVPDFIDAAANGLIAGGALGGILVDPSGYTETSGGGFMNLGNTPNPRADSGRIAVLV
jgi:hypothetical protein